MSVPFAVILFAEDGSSRLQYSTAVIQEVSRDPKRILVCASGLSRHPLIPHPQILTEKFGHPSRNLAPGVRIL